MGGGCSGAGGAFEEDAPPVSLIMSGALSSPAHPLKRGGSLGGGGIGDDVGGLGYDVGGLG